MSIYRDKKSGQWRFDFDRRINGARVRGRQLLPGGWSRAQADAFDRKEGASLYAIHTGIARPRHTIDEAVARFKREHVPGLKHGHNVALELDCTKDWWTGRAIDDLAGVCAAYAADQLGALAPATIKNRISYLRAACRWAWKRYGMAEADPGGRIVVPTVRNEREVTISRAEMLLLAQACPHRGVRALIRILFYSGLRVGEALRAKRVPGAFVLADTKNNRSHVVPMHPRLHCVAEVPMPKRGTINYWWRITRAACGLEHVHLHDIRHSTASEIIAGGGDLGDVGAVLNHASPASSKRYAHWVLERKAAAVALVGGRR